MAQCGDFAFYLAYFIARTIPVVDGKSVQFDTDVARYLPYSFYGDIVV